MTSLPLRISRTSSVVNPCFAMYSLASVMDSGESSLWYMTTPSEIEGHMLLATVFAMIKHQLILEPIANHSLSTRTRHHAATRIRVYPAMLAATGVPPLGGIGGSGTSGDPLAQIRCEIPK